MGNGDYINKLLDGVRGDKVLPTNEGIESSKHLVMVPREREDLELNELLESIGKFEVKGKAQRLIRIDKRTEEILKHVKSTFRIDVITFVNFLCWEFLRNHPELINKINQSPNRKKA